VLGTPLTLAAARALAAEVHRLRKSGRDVVADHLAAKHRQRAEVEEGAANAFAACARQFIDDMQSQGRGDGAQQPGILAWTTRRMVASRP
jgi:hypothetical protein